MSDSTEFASLNEIMRVAAERHCGRVELCVEGERACVHAPTGEPFVILMIGGAIQEGQRTPIFAFDPAQAANAWVKEFERYFDERSDEDQGDEALSLYWRRFPTIEKVESEIYCVYSRLLVSRPLLATTIAERRDGKIVLPMNYSIHQTTGGDGRAAWYFMHTSADGAMYQRGYFPTDEAAREAALKEVLGQHGNPPVVMGIDEAVVSHAEAGSWYETDAQIADAIAGHRQLPAVKKTVNEAPSGPVTHKHWTDEGKAGST